MYQKKIQVHLHCANTALRRARSVAGRAAGPMDPLAPPVASVHTGCLLLAALLLALLCRCASRALAHPPTHDDGELPELYASSRPCPRASAHSKAP